MCLINGLKNVLHVSTSIKGCMTMTLYIVDAGKDVGMKNISSEEAMEILEDMKVKIEVPKAAVTQNKRNAALDMAIEALNRSEIPNGSELISKQAAIDEVVAWLKDRMTDGKNGKPLTERLKDLPSAEPEQSITQERYEDLCEYFKDCSDQGRSTLTDRKEFKAWLDRVKWHVMECDKLGRELEKLKSAQPEIIRINLNEPIKVKLTDWGKEIYYHQYDRTNQIAGREICKPKFPKEDENGYTEFQLWCFMELYGECMGMTLPNVIKPLEIVYER